MIEITPNIKTEFADVFRLARKDRMRVVWLEPGIAYVARRGPGHDKYIVKFHALDNRSFFSSCKSITGRTCEGRVFKGLCAHAAKAILRAESKPAKKQGRKAA